MSRIISIISIITMLISIIISMLIHTGIVIRISMMRIMIMLCRCGPAPLRSCKGGLQARAYKSNFIGAAGIELDLCFLCPRTGSLALMQGRTAGEGV